MTRFNFNGHMYVAMTMTANAVLKRCKDLVHLSVMGSVNRRSEILALLAEVAGECLVVEEG